MSIGKALNVCGCVCQMLALFIASKIDIKSMEIKQAESEVPDDFLSRYYDGTKVGETVEPYPQEKKLQALEDASNATSNLFLFRFSIGLGFIGTLLVLIANVITD